MMFLFESLSVGSDLVSKVPEKNFVHQTKTYTVCGRISAAPAFAIGLRNVMKP